jgi:hypothetical protein
MFIADPTKRSTDVFLYTLHPTRPAMLTEGAVMNSDPAVKGGLFRAKLFPFQPMLIASQE